MNICIIIKRPLLDRGNQSFPFPLTGPYMETKDPSGETAYWNLSPWQCLWQLYSFWNNFGQHVCKVNHQSISNILNQYTLLINSFCIIWQPVMNKNSIVQVLHSQFMHDIYQTCNPCWYFGLREPCAMVICYFCRWSLQKEEFTKYRTWVSTAHFRHLRFCSSLQQQQSAVNAAAVASIFYTQSRILMTTAFPGKIVRQCKSTYGYTDTLLVLNDRAPLTKQTAEFLMCRNHLCF